MEILWASFGAWSCHSGKLLLGSSWELCSNNRQQQSVEVTVVAKPTPKSVAKSILKCQWAGCHCSLAGTQVGSVTYSCLLFGSMTCSVAPSAGMQLQNIEWKRQQQYQIRLACAMASSGSSLSVSSCVFPTSSIGSPGSPSFSCSCC